MNYTKENIIVTDPWNFSSVLEHFPHLSESKLISRMMEAVINKIPHAKGEVVIYLITEWQRPASYIFLFSILWYIYFLTGCYTFFILPGILLMLDNGQC
jgi:hypothetical protein